MHDKPTLTFIFSPMEGGKTRQIITERWETEERNIKTILAKPAVDKKAGEQIISRFGNMTSSVDVILQPQDDVVTSILSGIGGRAMTLEGGELAAEYARLRQEKLIHTLVHLGTLATHESPWAIYIDESQFLNPEQVRGLRTLVDDYGVGVEAFGLRTDFRGEFFPGSDVLMRTADHIREIQKACKVEGCGNNAIYNSRLVNGLIVTEGPQVAIDGIDAVYAPICSSHYAQGQQAVLRLSTPAVTT